jgi:hypothetical protein
MTRKDFELIARAVRGATVVGAPAMANDAHEFMRGARDQFRSTVQHLADALESTNPHFNRALFIKACEVQS